MTWGKTEGESTMAAVLSPKATGGLKVPQTQFENRRGRGTFGRGNLGTY